MAEKAILIDTSKCIACKGCQISCKQWNELTAGTSEFFGSTQGYENPSDLSYHTFNLIKFHSDEKPNGDPDWLFRKWQCMHCTDAACVAVCPRSGEAMQKDPATGFVWVNRDNCIGCKLCGTACPFGIPRYPDDDEIPEGDEIPKAYKCWGCLDRQTNGEEPSCVKTCAPGAATYGDRDAQIAKAESRKSELEAKGKTVWLYGVNEQGGLHYIYLLLRDPSFYGLPTLAELSSSARRTYLRQLKEMGKQYLKNVVSF
jgi:formate dehydrogenase iron-sulfur subunit